MRAPTARRSAQRRCTWLAGLGLLACLLGGCSSGSTANSSTLPSTPSYVTEPPTHQQLLVNKGAQLVVSDGCAACHLNASAQRAAPSFYSLAGNQVTLIDGRHVLIDERFLREAMLDPRATLIRGYDPRAMLAALRRLHLDEHPVQVTALAAFIEQIGPEPE
jgi:hypothetical protein